MTLTHTQKEILQEVQKARTRKKKIGFVPTMGALHEGHKSLIDFGLQNCDVIVVSIFVNPTQFNNASDLEKYPRTLKEDASLLKEYSTQVIIYAPSPQEVYGSTIISKKYNFGGLEHTMEGEHRPGHFDGVGTVLNLLFRQVKPDIAYFGEKDFQQLQIVKRLVAIEKLPVKVVGCPIHRAASGLAMSSRNARLTKQQLEDAPFIYKILNQARTNFKTQSALTLRNWVSQQFSEHPRLELEYFEIANVKNLSPLSRKRKHQKYRAFLAVFAGEIRLIDNIALN